MISIGKAKTLKTGRADSRLSWASVGRKKFFILRQKGTYADIAYDHGQLLADEMEKGVFPEILDTIRTGTDTSSDVMDWIISAVYRRLSDDVFEATSEEFRAGAKAVGDGMFDALDNPRFTPEDVRDALVAIDVGNLAEGLTRRMEKPLASEVSETIFYVLGAARRYRRRKPPRADGALSDKGALGAGLQRMNQFSRRVGFGCSAMGAAAGLTEDGKALHARTFDGAFFAWNNFPGLFIVDERDTNPKWHRYVAVGTAGLIYSGGISGLNEAGLAASIHQMSTVNYDTGRPERGYAVAPYLQQRILREAGTLAEAEKILKTSRHFASWTIVVTDAKAGKSARFEINGGTQTVARINLGAQFTQSNHFMADGMAEEHRFFKDAHFTPTLGKWLETRARLETMSAAFKAGKAAGKIGTDWAMDLLASHADGALDGAPRSFGRTISRAYGLMGSIARLDPDRSRAKDEIWFSIGDSRPGPQASFVGFAVDWDKLEFRPIGQKPVRKAKTVSRAFARSLSDYVHAFETLARPTDARDAYLGRDPTKSELKALTRQAADLMDKATKRAEDAGEMDFAFRYARARLSLACGRLSTARADLDFLRALPGLHPWETALTLIVSGVAEKQAGHDAEAGALLDQGEAALKAVRKAFFPGRTRPHKSLEDWQKVIDAFRAGDPDAELPEFDFVTVE